MNSSTFLGLKIPVLNIPSLMRNRALLSYKPFSYLKACFYVASVAIPCCSSDNFLADNDHVIMIYKNMNSSYFCSLLPASHLSCVFSREK